MANVGDSNMNLAGDKAAAAAAPATGGAAAEEKESRRNFNYSLVKV